MNFVIRISGLGGVFVEEEGGREWGERILRVEAADEAAVYQTAEYREAQELAEKIRGEEDDPLPPTLEEVKPSFMKEHKYTVKMEHRECVNVHAPTIIEAIELATEGREVRTMEVTDHGIVRYFRDRYGFPTWAAETLDVWGDCSPGTEEENAAFEEMRCDT